MKNIETYLTLEEYLTSIVTGDHKAPNVAQIGDIGEEYYRYDKNVITQESNPALFNIAISAGWNFNSETAITNNELSLVNTGDFISAIQGNTTLTTFNEFKYFDKVGIITKSMFSGCTSITEITIPKSVKTIENGSFSSFPSGAKILYEGKKSDINFVDSLCVFSTFSAGTNVNDLRIIGGNLTSFKNDFSYIEVSGNGVNVLAASEDITSLYLASITTDITSGSIFYVKYYPKQVDSKISVSGFSNLVNMISVEMPESLSKILNDSMFSDCSGLETISLPRNINNIPRNFFYGCRSLKSFTIQNTVTKLNDYAFNGCSSISGIVIPSSVTEIGVCCFSGCSSLTGIVIPSSVTSLGNYCFHSCRSLKNITLPNSINRIPIYCFYGCNSLKNITIPNSVTEIGTYAFYNCNGLSNVTIPDYVTLIESYAFTNCNGLTGLTIGTGITNISSSAFYGLKMLQSDFVNNSQYTAGTPWGVTFYGSDVVKDGVLYLSGTNREYLIRCVIDAENVTIPNSVTYVGASAFSWCTELTSVTFHSNVTSLGDACFYGCHSLREIPVMPGITGLPQYCFYYCSGFTDITIPNNIKFIGGYSFASCSNLEEITFSSTSVTGMGGYVFSSSSNLKTIDVSVYDTTLPSIGYTTFYSVPKNGTLVTSSSVQTGNWMSNSNYYLGYQGWTREIV